MSRPLTRALFVSGSLGKGHDVLAEACAAALTERAVQSETVDAMRMLGGGFSNVGDWLFRRMLSVDALYDAFHFSQLRDDGGLARFMDRLAVGKMFSQLRATVDRLGPELVVSVFATGAGAAARLKAEGYPVTSVVVMTDSFAHRFWVYESTDLFLVTSSAAGESVRRYWPEAPVEVITAPVRPEFYYRAQPWRGPSWPGRAHRRTVCPADVRRVGSGPARRRGRRPGRRRRVGPGGGGQQRPARTAPGGAGRPRVRTCCLSGLPTGSPS